MRFLSRSAGRLSTPFGQFGDICRMIKIEHSVFALPYAWAGAFLAARGLPSARSLIFLTIGMHGINNGLFQGIQKRRAKFRQGRLHTPHKRANVHHVRAFCFPFSPALRTILLLTHTV